MQKLRYLRKCSMIFISGISQKDKKLDFKQECFCPECKRQCYLEVDVSYTFFSVFFIPTFKWNKRYYSICSCCGAIFNIDKEIGKSIERGEKIFIPDDALIKENTYYGTKRCRSCGFVSPSDYEYCPKCGNRIN